MLENLGLFAAALCTLFGADLLYDAASAHDQGAAFRLLGGAVALVAGLVTVVLVIRSKLYWRRIRKQYRDRT
jgi:hypothetical protein